MSDAPARFEAVLRFAATRGISDVHVKPLQRPVYRRHGTLISRKDEGVFSEAELDEVVRSLLPAGVERRWRERGDATFVYGLVGCGRFRVTCLQQRGAVGLSVRLLPARVATLRELNLPKVLATWAQAGGGLVLVCGGAGTGRTSTWQALVEHVNTAGPPPRHVVTLEDPIEVLFDDKIAFVRQREIGSDAPDLAAALQPVARLDADVVVLADLAAADLGPALTLAEEGRLVIVGLAGAGPVAVLQALLDATPADTRAGLRRRLARTLRGAVGLRLVPGADGKGRLPAAEVLVPTPAVQEHLAGTGDLEALYALMDQGRAAGMQGFDLALLDLVQAGQITLEAALGAARRPDELRTRFAGQRLTSPVVQPPPDERLF